MEEGRSVFKILTGKPTRNELSGMLTCRWEDNIRMKRKYVSIRGIGLIDLRIGTIGEPL